MHAYIFAATRILLLITYFRLFYWDRFIVFIIINLVDKENLIKHYCRLCSGLLPNFSWAIWLAKGLKWELFKSNLWWVNTCSFFYKLYAMLLSNNQSQTKWKRTFHYLRRKTGSWHFHSYISDSIHLWTRHPQQARTTPTFLSLLHLGLAMTWVSTHRY